MTWIDPVAPRMISRAVTALATVDDTIAGEDDKGAEGSIFRFSRDLVVATCG